uniref:FBA_2 domain-containing protein n=2 Tax=Caenorhabditis tropicalis TaxID=1561998 RepID=A0A1I7UV32_9PELO
MDRFALFRLPTVALSEVMKMFPLFEITLLSLCSQKTRTWIKAFRLRRKDLRINFNFGNDTTVSVVNKPAKEFFVFCSKYPLWEMKYSVRLGNLTIPICIQRDRRMDWMDFRFIFDDRIKGNIMIAEYLCSLFEKDISQVFFTSLFFSDYQKVMEWVTERQKRFISLKAACHFTYDTEAAFLLENIKNANNVHFNLKLTPNFKAHFKFDGQVFEIDQGFWFTLDNLMSINCLELYVKGSQLTNKEMNTFLKHWISNKLLKFKIIGIGLETINLEALFDGIPMIRRSNDVRRFYGNIKGRAHFVVGGFDIQRNDGMTATIVCKATRIQPRRTWMIVWDNLSV